MEQLLDEVRYTVRRLRRSPVATAVAVLTLAVGIGATTAVYTLVDRVLLRPLPFADAERLVVLWERNAEQGRERDPVSPANYLDWEARARTLEGTAAFHHDQTTLTGTGEPLQLTAARVTPGTFSLLGVPPLLGRGMAEGEAEPGAEPVAVLSQGLWQRVFGGRPETVGSTVLLDGQAHQVIGVMPRTFQFPDATAEVWLPLGFAGPVLGQRSRRSLGVVGRLREGVGVDEARAELAVVAAALAAEHPRSNEGWGVDVVPAREQLVEDVRPALLAMMAAVVLVLLLAAANLAALLMARTAARQREFAIRMALGAGRPRIARQTLLEALLVSLAGGVAGLAVAALLVRALGRGLGEYLPLADLVSVDGRAAAFALATSLAVGALLGAAPALRSARAGELELRAGTATAGRGRGRFQNALVVGQVALALVLAVGAGLLVQSFLRLQRVDPGFDPRGVVVAGVSLPDTRYPDEQDQLAFFERLLERLRARPEVAGAGAVSTLPLSAVGIDFDLPVEIAGIEAAAPGEEPQADFRVASPGYFEAMGMRLLDGRFLAAADRDDAPRVMVVNRAMARRFWGERSPVGERVGIPMGGPHEVVGVVDDVRHQGLDREPRPEMYVPAQQVTFASMTVVARTRGDPRAFLGALAREVRAIDRDQPVSDERTLEAVVAASTAEARLGSALAAAMAVAALFLAALGIYGMLSYAVASRTRELGVRIALGASPRRIVAMVLGSGLRLTAAGVVLGLALTLWSARAIRSLLFGIEPFDAATFAGVALVLAAVAVAASALPVRRAVRTEPALTLREE